MNYEIAHAVHAVPFSNKCHCSASIALKDWLRVALKDWLRVALKDWLRVALKDSLSVVATVFSGIPRLILSRKRFLCPGCIVSRAAFPVPCSLFPVPFVLPFAYP